MVSDPQAKADRADEHIRTLKDLVAAFAEQAYSVDMHPDFWDPSTSPDPKGDVVIFVDAAMQPPSDLWGPIIGDVVHGFRSALDNLVWQLSVTFQTQPPPPDPIPKNSRWRDISFPIRTDSSNWPNTEDQKLWAINPALLASVEALQPYATGQNAPDREPLAVLEELWNIDKHRHLHLVNTTVELQDVLSVKPFPDAPHVDFEVVSKRAPGPLVGRTEVGRARLIRRPGGVLGMTLPQMHMDPRLAIDVAFDQGPPTHGRSVLQTLSEISQTVQSITAAF